MRSEASKSRIVAALLSLCREGEPTPSADAVAQRAGVGRRSVFRHFKDMDNLFAAMHRIMRHEVEHLVVQDVAGATWKERLDELIARRIEFFERILPVKSGAEAHRHRSAFLKQEHARLTALLRERLTHVLPAAMIDAPARLDALDLALSFEAWRRLRQEQRLDRAAAAAVVRLTVAALTGED